MMRPTFRHHRKLRRAARLLNAPESHVCGYCEFLWFAFFEAGDPVLGDVLDVEAAADYPGDPGTLVRALLDCGGEGRPGLLEEVPGRPGLYQVHDAWDHAPAYVRKRLQREQERRHRPPRADSDQSVTSQRPDSGESVTRTPAPAPAPAQKKKRDPRASADAERGYPAGFIAFWQAYPKKRAKADALKAWKQGKCSSLLDSILAAVERAKASDEWQRDGGRFVKHPATWLRDQGWEDEFEVPPETACREEEPNERLARESMKFDRHPQWKAYMRLVAEHAIPVGFERYLAGLQEPADEAREAVLC